MWIESHQELRDHPKTRRLARALGVGVPAAIGHLHCLWWFALDYAPDGDLSGFAAWEIADAAMWDGDPDAFVAALADVRYIDGDDGRTLHDWHQYGGKVLQRRRVAGERARAWRSGLRNLVIARDGYVCGICGGDVHPDDVHLDHIQPVSKGGPTTFENLRVTHSFCNISRGNREWTD